MPERAAHVAPNGGVPVGALRGAAGTRALVRVGDDDLQAPDFGVRQGVGSSFSSRPGSFLPGRPGSPPRARASGGGGDARAGVASSMAGMAGGEKMGVAGLASQVDGEARACSASRPPRPPRGAPRRRPTTTSRRWTRPSTRAGPRRCARSSRRSAAMRARGGASGDKTERPSPRRPRRPFGREGGVWRRRRWRRHDGAVRVRVDGAREVGSPPSTSAADVEADEAYSKTADAVETSGDVDAVVDAVEERNDDPRAARRRRTSDGPAVAAAACSWQTGATSSPSLA